MNTISDFPYFEVHFNKEGAIHDEQEARQVLVFLSEGKVTDLFVISHGWNNDIEGARELYKNFFAQVRAEINNRPPELGPREFAVIGILWPSKKFADEDLIPIGAASVGIAQSEEEEIRQWLESLKGVFDHPDADARLEQAKQLVDLIGSDENASAEFVDHIRSLPNKEELHPDDNSDEFFRLPSNELVDRLSRPDISVTIPAVGMGSAADLNLSAFNMGEGEAAGFSIFGGAKSAVRKVLNYTTYYQMKERAGTVGRKGAYQVLAEIREIAPDLKMHFIGHSFGGRLVTAIADGPEGSKPIKPASMTLLQAAFSHNGFAEKFDGVEDGFFRKVVSEKKVNGPILITHSVKDTAVGIAYPIASKLSGDDAASFGVPESRFGGIGRNGAQFTPEADNRVPLSPVASTYHFQPEKLYNLNADTLIMGHSDVTKAEIAHAVLCAVAST